MAQQAGVFRYRVTGVHNTPQRRPKGWTIRHMYDQLRGRLSVLAQLVSRRSVETNLMPTRYGLPVGFNDAVSRSHRACYKFKLTASSQTEASSYPVVQLDAATAIGKTNGSVTSFLGVLFAEPPIGDLRLRLPKLITAYSGTINATTYGAQQLIEDLEAYTGSMRVAPVVPESEDSLNINIMTPVGIDSNVKFPVLVWTYDVTRSIALGRPIIYVALNYRISCNLRIFWGKKIKDAGIGNLGLHDQRTALGWIQQHILASGGDPNKVTMAAFMNSGFPIPQTGCSNATDTLDCLRKAPLGLMKEAANNATSAFSYGNYYPDIWSAALASLFEAYPYDPAAGSPYDTGYSYAFTPEYKRMALLQDDLFFPIPRRFFLDQREGKHPTCSFISAQHSFPGLGAAHTPDLINVFSGGSMADYLIRFVATLDPNDGTEAVYWPRYNISQRQILTFQDGDTPLNISMNWTRMEGTRVLTRLNLADAF
ncbi:Lipase 3 [Grifola frondosa]|uniref:Lipase 3 n=1 Tax=Grifola frondosa TaxID=5627 RepID=A0A1C7LN04_GRIFR|nr:Lipase 3 [Grifola frondosa]